MLISGLKGLSPKSANIKFLLTTSVHEQENWQMITEENLCLTFSQQQERVYNKRAVRRMDIIVWE